VQSEQEQSVSEKLASEQAQVMIVQCDEQKRYKCVNAPYAAMFGLKQDDFIGKYAKDILGEKAFANASPHMDTALSGESSHYEMALPDTLKGPKVVSVSYSPDFDASGKIIGFIATVSDITQRKLLEKFNEDQLLILEQIADITVPLTNVLESLVQSIQVQKPDMIASVLLLSKDGKHLQHGAAPDLPDVYNQAMDGVAIGPCVGSFGTAAFTRERVIVSDIAIDPLWADYKGVALENGLMACWSQPIKDTKGKVLGTFAMYYKYIKSPAKQDLVLIDRAASLAANAISHKYAEQKLLDSNRELASTTRILENIIGSIPARVFWKDKDLRYRGCNVLFAHDAGLTRQEEVVGKTDMELGFGEQAHLYRADDKEVMDSGEAKLAFEETQPTPDGDMIWVRTSKVPLRDEKNMINGVLGLYEDITKEKKAGKELEAMNTLLSETFEGMSDGFVAFDKKMNYTFVNSWGASILGRQPEELIGKNYWLEYPEAKGTPFADAYEKVLESHEAILFEDYYAPFDRWFENRIYPSKNGLSVFFSDITKRKKIELKLRRMTDLYTASSLSNRAILHSNNEHDLFPRICRKIVAYGGMKMAWLGLVDEKTQMLTPMASFGSGVEYLDGIEISASADVASGRGPIGIVIREDEPYWCQDYMNDPLLALWHERGKRCGWGASAALPLHRRGQVIGVFMVYAGEANAFDEDVRNLLIDMSMEIDFALESFMTKAEHQQTEAELQTHREHLEEMVDDRTYELADANKKLRDLDKLKSMFIASMSHELRTPMNSILGFTDLILQGLSGDINSVQREQLQRVHGSGKHLLMLITDVIDLSKVEAGKIELTTKEFELRDLLNEVVIDNSIEAQERGLNLELKPLLRDIPMFSDRRRLLQCLLNLVSNAVKYSKQGDITLTADTQGDEVIIAVQDCGIGMSSDEVAELFQPFVRLDSELSIKAGGTGLGLYLTKKLATEILGGSIDVESRAGVGSRFTLRLPLRLPSHTATSHIKATNPKETKHV